MATDQSSPPIRDAATLVVVDRSSGPPRILMGRRRPDQVFLPNKFVFPGGRVDDDDAFAPSIDDLDQKEADLLSLPREGQFPSSAAAARALMLAAVRETFEETGMAAGVRTANAGGLTAPPAWAAFLSHGVVPRLSGLRFFLRAITPTARPRRYDTRFFLMDAGEIAVRGAATDEELWQIGWFGLDAADELDVPRITRIVLRELRACLKTGLPAAELRRVPFYFEVNDVMQRAELSLAPARP